jgi:hypothetical protein
MFFDYASTETLARLRHDTLLREAAAERLARSLRHRPAQATPADYWTAALQRYRTALSS